MPVFPKQAGSVGTWGTELRDFFSPFFNLDTGETAWKVGSTSDLGFKFSGNPKCGLCRPTPDNLGLVAADRIRFFAPDEVNSFVDITRNVGVFAGGEILFGAGGGNATEVGVGRLGTNILGLMTAGLERARIDASGRVGIGAQAPTATLHVRGSGPTFLLEHTGGPDLELHTNDGNGLAGLRTSPQSSALSIQDSGDVVFCRSSGKVGIGTAVPGAKLHVENAAADYFQYGTNNPRMYLLAPSGLNGFRIDADTTPFEMRKLGDLTRQVSFNGGDLSMTFAPTDATAVATLRESQAIFLNGKYWDGAASQTAFQARLYAKTISTAAPRGGLSLGTTGGGADLLFLRDDGNVGLRTMDQFGGGTGVIGLANASVVPGANPSAGGVLYADAGALKYRGSSGTVTTLGPAEPHCDTCGRDFVLEYESEVYGYLALCVWCLVDAVGLETGRGLVGRRTEPRYDRPRGFVFAPAA